MTFTVKVTEQAQAQMRDIARYIALELKDRDAALRLLDTLETSIASLSQFPHSVVLTEDEPWHSQGIHKLPVKNFLVYSWIDESRVKAFPYRLKGIPFLMPYGHTLNINTSPNQTES